MSKWRRCNDGQAKNRSCRVPRRRMDKEVSTVTQYEKITQSPGMLGAFLAALPVIHGPWDAEFQARFCAGCAVADCDACPHTAERNNPRWWLTLEADGGGDADRFAVIVTYHTGAITGAVVEAESAGAAWRKVFTVFSPEIIASATVSRILTPERGATAEPTESAVKE